jgi:hypothetical protein
MTEVPIDVESDGEPEDHEEEVVDPTTINLPELEVDENDAD